MEENGPFRIFTAAVFVALILPTSLQDGMFMDGLIYASVSHNLSQGIGSPWFLKFSDTYWSLYSEQLPLFFWIQSFFYKILGSSIYTERIFCFIMAIISAFNISLIWKTIHPSDIAVKKHEWLPILFWIITPVSFWTFTHNVQEVLMTVFATASVYFILKGLIKKQQIIVNILLGGLFIFLCSFCKGFQGLFPLVAVFIYWMIFRNFSFLKNIIYSTILISVPAFIYLFLFLNETSFESISNFANNRLVRTFTNPAATTTDNRFKLIIRLFNELIPCMIVSGLIFLWTKKHIKEQIIQPDWKYFSFFILLGLSGSLPLIVTLEQRGFYLATSLPFFALGFACLIQPYFSSISKTIKVGRPIFKWSKKISIVLFLTVIIFSFLQVGKTKRDHDRLHDVYAIGEKLPRFSKIDVLPIVIHDYAFGAYLVRHYNISLDFDPTSDNEFYLHLPNMDTAIPEGYEKTDLELKMFDLYQKEK